MHSGGQPYTISFACPECGKFMVSSARFLPFTAYDFFEDDWAIRTITRLVEDKGKRECSGCDTAMVITHIEYGRGL